MVEAELDQGEVFLVFLCSNGRDRTDVLLHGQK
jgi:hypothetical protein